MHTLTRSRLASSLRHKGYGERAYIDNKEIFSHRPSLDTSPKVGATSGEPHIIHTYRFAANADHALRLLSSKFGDVKGGTAGEPYKFIHSVSPPKPRTTYKIASMLFTLFSRPVYRVSTPLFLRARVLRWRIAASAACG